MLRRYEESLAKLILKRSTSSLMRVIPEGELKFILRSAVAKLRDGISPGLLVNPREIVVLAGCHRIDTVTLWSFLVGNLGKIVVVEAVPAYIENLRLNLEHHLSWPLQNIIYVAKGIGAAKTKSYLEIGKVGSYNKIIGHGISDGLSASDYISNTEIEVDSLDSILVEAGIDHVNHIQMTISGMELEALKGMTKTLLTPGLRLEIRSLHMKEGRLIYPQVVDFLKQCGFKTVVERENKRFPGRNVYACRIEN